MNICFTNTWKQNKDGQLLDENKQYNLFEKIRILSESDIDKVKVRSELEKKIRKQETKYSGWRFDEYKSGTIFSYKTTKLIGSSSVKIRLRPSAISNNENSDK